MVTQLKSFLGQETQMEGSETVVKGTLKGLFLP